MDQAGNPVKFQVKFHATIFFKAIAHAHQTLTLEYLCGSWAGLGNIVQVVRRWMRLPGGPAIWDWNPCKKWTKDVLDSSQETGLLSVAGPQCLLSQKPGGNWNLEVCHHLIKGCETWALFEQRIFLSVSQTHPVYPRPRNQYSTWWRIWPVNWNCLLAMCVSKLGW